MLLKTIFLFVIFSSSLAQECKTPLVQALPASSFSATSNSLQAPNVRFTTKEPWCPDTPDDSVTIDFQCVHSVCQMEGNYDGLLFYSGDYSTDGSTWKLLSSSDETYYVPDLKMFVANERAVITPPIKARFFRFRPSLWVGGEKHCIKVELYDKSVSDSVEPLGCYKEKAKAKKSTKAMPVVYHSVSAKTSGDLKSPDILAIYEECRQKAEEYKKFQIEVFGINNYRRCVTTASGKEDQYSRYGKISKCTVCGGKGIGTKKWSTFVYKRQL